MKQIFLLLLLGNAAFAGAQQCSGILTGHVHHSASHENLAGASVYVAELNQTRVTNDKGDFKFDSLCAGHYTLHISHISFDTVIRYVGLQGASHLDVDMPLNKTTLEGVTVAANRQPSTGIRKELAGAALEEARGRSFSEALARINGVTLLQTGSTIAKPVIHGLHGNRILTINNGVRQEGQQWGNEHAPEVDPFIAGRLSVISGVDQLRYGSDAIGGVILVSPRALRQQPGHQAEVNTVYATNNGQALVSGVWEQASKKWEGFAYRLQGTLKQGGNVTTPDYRLNNTSNREGNFSVTAGYRRHHLSTELFYSYFNTKLGVFSGAHIGNLTDLQKAMEATRPDPAFTGNKGYEMIRPYQAVVHQLLKSQTTVDIGGHKLGLLLSGQLNDREEYDVVRNAANRRPQLNLNIGTLQQELSWESPRKGNWQHSGGVVSMQQNNSYSGRYFIPAYRAFNFGGYYLLKWNREAWDLHGGLRYDHRAIHSNRLRAGGAEFANYDFNFSTMGASLQAGFRATEHWKWTAGATLSSRAPHVNELLSNGIHHGTATYEVGDISLKPEQSLYLHVGQNFSNKSGTLSGELTVYHNRINRFIYQQPVPGEPVLTISGAFPKLVYSQTDASLQGVDASLSWELLPRLEWTNRYAMLRARNLVADDWLIRMPADRFTTGFKYALKDGARRSNTYLQVEGMQVWRQTRVPDESAGKQDYQAPPPAYFLVHTDAATTVRLGQVPVTFGLSVRNALNRSYRDYLNNLRFFTDEMGRNIQLRLKVPLGKS
ncbi:iron complex outermembrane recepter protein [Cnuella takakiae]|uniref:Iron complex outermembrane recepter protein n=1 Tax=Cnuella takakiae TaxID=1302690 RepID=A0A1M5G353_9BACT|nr:TonB-dependent receptor [Cnuella takakiae]OLY92319.1 hypothetical protein BUE76_10735 [Cnuella takakiae]SHF98240.1 iron complex outermembrane recepter protein [Cnuella takakiae]